jgi:hypothetical protein
MSGSDKSHTLIGFQHSKNETEDVVKFGYTTPEKNEPMDSYTFRFCVLFRSFDSFCTDQTKAVEKKACSFTMRFNPDEQSALLGLISTSISKAVKSPTLGQLTPEAYTNCKKIPKVRDALAGLPEITPKDKAVDDHSPAAQQDGGAQR